MKITKYNLCNSTKLSESQTFLSHSKSDIKVHAFFGLSQRFELLDNPDSFYVNMLHYSRYILFLLLFFFSSTLLSQEIVLAVIDFEGKGVSQVEASALTDRLRTEILSTVKMKVVERGEMEELLKEQAFQQSGCVSSECMVEVGKLLGANQIVGGSISRVGNTFSVSARIIDVETGEIINSTNYDYSGIIDELLISGMKNVSQLLFTADEGIFLDISKDVEYFKNGRIKSEGRSITGIKIGRWIYYHEEGRIEKVGSYKDGKESGKWTYYYKNGKVKQEGNYSKNGEMIGKWTYYHPNGIVEKEGAYDQNGKETDKWTYFYSNGVIEKEGFYKDGKRDWLWKYYYSNGKKQKVGHYHNGLETDKWNYYNEDGQLQSEGNYQRGGKIGEWLNYYNFQDKNIVVISHYNVYGEPAYKSKLIEYYKNGNIKAEVEKKGKLVHGKRSVYDIDRKVLNEERFKRGNGIYVDYYENGQIKEKGSIKNYAIYPHPSLRVGIWIEYDVNGEVSEVNYNQKRKY